jgi:two-component system, LytTR family, sensor kinase
MKHSKLVKFLMRFLVIFSIQLIFKAFDQTFGHFTDFELRGVLFSLFFISYWLIIWYIGELLNEKIHQKTRLLKLVLNSIFGYSAAFGTNALYRWGDINWFNNEEIWKTITTFNPEFTISLLLLYLLVWGTDQFYQTDIILKEEQLKAEKLLRENTLAQYMSLKAQIEPHFLFNSLSVLSSLINSNQKLASEFNLRLSKALRYIIEKNEFTLVPLEEELLFVNDYFFLINTRFTEGIQLRAEIPEDIRKNRFIPPASVQLLVENAIHHNKFSSDQPLEIKIAATNEWITVQNNINKRSEKDSIGKGLENLKSRYALISQSELKIEEAKKNFIVKIPLLGEDYYEDFNN